MATLRVRFSGLCLFYRPYDDAVCNVRVLPAPHHQPELWVDCATTIVRSGARVPFATGPECVLEHHGTLAAELRDVHKYFLYPDEVISFEDGQTPGPTYLPGVASLTEVEPNMVGVRPAGVRIRLTYGTYELGPKRAVIWHDLPSPPPEPPNKLPLWTDLVTDSDQSTISIESTRGDLVLEPCDETEMRVWILSDDVRAGYATRKAEHFKHHYLYGIGSRHAPWPELEEDLPGCPPLVGSTFCPDGQYP